MNAYQLTGLTLTGLNLLLAILVLLSIPQAIKRGASVAISLCFVTVALASAVFIARGLK